MKGAGFSRITVGKSARAATVPGILGSNLDSGTVALGFYLLALNKPWDLDSKVAHSRALTLQGPRIGRRPFVYQPAQERCGTHGNYGKRKYDNQREPVSRMK
jgi:hypothetical protein